MDEFLELIENAKKNTGCSVSVEFRSDGQWVVSKASPGGVSSQAVRDLTDVIDTLREWAKSPLPESITLPPLRSDLLVDLCREIGYGNGNIHKGSKLHIAIKNALDQYRY